MLGVHRFSGIILPRDLEKPPDVWSSNPGVGLPAIHAHIMGERYLL